MSKADELLNDAEIAEFWSRVDKTGECWLWLGARSKGTSAQYGSFKSRRAHRVAYRISKGPIPQGLVLDHLCRVTLCVRPDHLEPVTNKENILRGVSFSALNVVKTHCPSGHEYTPENTLIVKAYGWRQCRICRAEHLRKSGAKFCAQVHEQRQQRRRQSA